MRTWERTWPLPPGPTASASSPYTRIAASHEPQGAPRADRHRRPRDRAVPRTHPAAVAHHRQLGQPDRLPLVARARGGLGAPAGPRHRLGAGCVRAAREPVGRPRGCAGRRADPAPPVREEQDQPGAQRSRAGGRQAPEPLERSQRPTDAEDRQEHRAHPEHAPQTGADLVAPAAGDGQPQQGESEEQPDREGADADELLARLAVHVMRRSAYTGTTPKRSGRAAKATSSPRSASTSCWAASELSSASCQPANWSIRATVARAASLRTSLRIPFRIALMRRPAVYASSKANCLSRPPHTITRSPRCARIARARSASALKFAGAPTSTGSPPCVATSAGVPLLVASTMVFPATAAAVISRGELPRANPSIFTLRRSPARTTPSFSRFEASRTASSEDAAGITALAPLASAVTMVVVARSASTTTTPRPARSPATRPSGVKWTSIFMPGGTPGGVGVRARGTSCPPGRR